MIHLSVRTREKVPEKLAEIRSQGTGVGIRGMRERDRHLGGELTIESNEFGTRLSAIFPAKTPPISSRDTVQQIEVA